VAKKLCNEENCQLADVVSDVSTFYLSSGKCSLTLVGPKMWSSMPDCTKISLSLLALLLSNGNLKTPLT